MSSEPRTIGAAEIFKRTGGLRHRNHRHPSANALPCMSMEDRQGLEHVRFKRDHAPARPDNVVKESLSAVQADASLREELAAVSDQVAHGLNSAKFDGFLGNETNVRFPLGLVSIQQRVVRPTGKYEVELPGEIVAVAYPRTHDLEIGRA